MRPSDFDIQKLIESLQGTCSTIEEHLPEGMEWVDLTKEDHEAIDAEIFLCEQCGWWCERNEESEQEEYVEHCKDCAMDE